MVSTMSSADPGRDALRDVYRSYGSAHGRSRHWVSDNQGNQEIVRERLVAIDGIVANWWNRQRSRCGSEVVVLDLGCGSGSSTPEFGVIDRQVTRIGVELLFERLAQGESGVSSVALPIHLVCADGAQLPFRSATFDLIVMSTVLSSVLDPLTRGLIAAEVQRVLAPGGLMIWYDMRWPNPANRKVRPVGRRELSRLFSGLQGRPSSMTLVPQVARRLGKRAVTWYPRLVAIPALRSHLIAGLEQPWE
jgi:ubiquinone/menaquinone biosynthesis C-methylase UbiE